MCTTILMEGIIATTHSVVDMAITSLQQTIRWSIWPLHHCNNSFGGQYGHYIIATTHSVVNMAITSLQQTIRWSISSLHRCNNSFGGQYRHYIVAINHSVVNMAIYIVAATCFHKQSSYFADKMNFLKKSLAPFGLF